MQEQPKLGQIITENVGRDCIHIAIAPMVASCELWAGTRIGILRNGEASDEIDIPIVGVVDPFLTLPGLCSFLTA